MKKAAVPILVAVMLLTVAVLAEAQQPGKVYRIGYLGTNPPPADWWDALLDGLRERGYSEGRNLVFERWFSEGNASAFRRSPPRWSNAGSISSSCTQRPPRSPPSTRPRRFRSFFRRRSIPWERG